jgi:pimeloyl-ACP methyl ester carboxylesterase
MATSRVQEQSPTRKAGARCPIAFDDVGAGEPTVVLIHGGFANRGHYAAQVEHLARRHRVLALDLPGHGESAVPEAGFGVRDFAEDVVALCEEAGAGPAVLCGHSVGGTIALHVAVRHPALVKGVVLLDGVILFPEPARARALTTLVPALEGPRWLDALRQYFGPRFGPYDSPALKARVFDEMARMPRHVPAAFMRDLMSSDYAAEVSAATCPLLYVHATAPADLERLRRLQPDALIGCVVGSGHWVALQVPDQVNAMLDRFLQIIAAHE